MTAALRTGLIAQVHIAKKQLGLDDDLYRDTLYHLTGTRSAKDCSIAQLNVVVGHLSKQGFKAPQRGLPASSKIARKVQALWVSGYNLGVMGDPTDRAMEAFILRQTGIARAAWLRDPGDGDKVVEALKAWLAREAGVNWKRDPTMPGWFNMPGCRVALRQWEMLREKGVVEAGHSWTGNETGTLEEMLAYARAVAGGDPMEWTHGQWAKVHKALGNKLRKAR